MCIAMIIQYHILLDNSYCLFPEHLKPVDESLETLRYQFRVFKKQQISQISDFLLDVNIIVSGGIQNVIGVFQKLQKWTDLEISPFPGFFRSAETIRGSKIQVNQQTKPEFSKNIRPETKCVYLDCRCVYLVFECPPIVSADSKNPGNEQISSST